MSAGPRAELRRHGPSERSDLETRRVLLEALARAKRAGWPESAQQRLWQTLKAFRRQRRWRMTA